MYPKAESRIKDPPWPYEVLESGDKFWWLPKSQALRFGGGPQGLKFSLKNIKNRCFGLFS